MVNVKVTGPGWMRIEFDGVAVEATGIAPPEIGCLTSGRALCMYGSYVAPTYFELIEFAGGADGHAAFEVDGEGDGCWDVDVAAHAVTVSDACADGLLIAASSEGDLVAELRDAVTRCVNDIGDGEELSLHAMMYGADAEEREATETGYAFTGLSLDETRRIVSERYENDEDPEALSAFLAARERLLTSRHPAR